MKISQENQVKNAARSFVFLYEQFVSKHLWCQKQKLIIY